MIKLKSILACAALCITATFASSLFAECPGGYCSRPGMYAGNRTGWGTNPSYHTQSGAYATDLYGSNYTYSSDFEFSSGYPSTYSSTPYSYSSYPSYGSGYGGYSYSDNAPHGLYQQTYNYQNYPYSGSYNYNYPYSGSYNYNYPYSGSYNYNYPYSGSYQQNINYQNYSGQNFYRANDGRGQHRSR